MSCWNEDRACQKYQLEREAWSDRWVEDGIVQGDENVSHTSVHADLYDYFAKTLKIGRGERS
jgi:hypothetical protein